jgi:hypothetical protein
VRSEDTTVLLKTGEVLTAEGKVIVKHRQGPEGQEPSGFTLALQGLLLVWEGRGLVKPSVATLGHSKCKTASRGPEASFPHSTHCHSDACAPLRVSHTVPHKPTPTQEVLESKILTVIFLSGSH